MKRILVAAASVILFTSVAQANIPDNAYLWIHPKLGAIWVEKTSNAPIVSATIRSASAVTVQPGSAASGRTDEK